VIWTRHAGKERRKQGCVGAIRSGKGAFFQVTQTFNQIFEGKVGETSEKKESVLDLTERGVGEEGLGAHGGVAEPEGHSYA